MTGLVEAHRRHLTSARGALLTHAVIGALLAAAAYGCFVIAGFAVSVLTFSGAPDAGPALLCVVVACAGFLLARWLQPVMASHFGLPEPRRPSGRRDLRDVLDARPRGGRATMWLGGVGLALLPALYGIQCIVTRRGEAGGFPWSSTVEGGAAVVLGLGWIGVGLFLHIHFFFGLEPRLEPHSRAGKYLSLIMACAGLTVGTAWGMIAKAS
ncbi:MAG: hypothetical protein E6K81_13510 [Candidatus Eisenbacteria bacterium]|uniref:Uncharacterized protein n=1 Tax=Eiseniibacteriota bacterium TaxID=2212470 RepID=A0A538U2E1_UNCEI|nr:MAG: hypothetical protein E6K81_13510 [Candidatus Eisenbacteria bacterium]